MRVGRLASIGTARFTSPIASRSAPPPATVERLQSEGLDAWLEAQLHPERVPDPRLEARLAALTTLTLTPRALAEINLRAQERRRASQAAMQTPGAGDGGLERAAGGAEPGMERSPRAEDRGPQRQVLLELATQKLVRATAAERQLEEVLVDFWFNHFNVFAGKGPVRQYVYDFERTAIRPHVFGSFRTMLGAVAGSPAMLFYLDNWQSSAPGTQTMRGPGGLNENYARELLELHTLGVDGGYSQADIVDVARAFTGWTIRGPRQGGDAIFDGRRHDRGAKTILGHVLPAGGGRGDGERVLDILARHPSTARFIARKLATRFVSDTPPGGTGCTSGVPIHADRRRPAGHRRGARQVTRVHRPERAPGEGQDPAGVRGECGARHRRRGADGRRPGAATSRAGHAAVLRAAPTGYSDRADAWTNAGALVQRMNIALALTQGRLRGVAPAGAASGGWRRCGDTGQVDGTSTALAGSVAGDAEDRGHGVDSRGDGRPGARIAGVSTEMNRRSQVSGLRAQA